jgi:hypothetical protein
MSTVNNGPQIVRNGLVLDLDAGYMKSYSPNVFPNPTDIFARFGSFGANAATLSRDETMTRQYGSIPMKMAVTGNDPFTNTINYGPNSAPSFNIAPATNGQTWTMSVYVKASVPTTGELFLFAADSNSVAITYAFTAITITTSWTRVSLTYTISSANCAFIQARVDGTPSGGSGINIWWDGMQIERASSATAFNPYYFGNTVWKDVSGNAVNFTTFNTPVFNNANYGALTFNGSSTYATAPENSLFNTDTLTIECWARTSSINQNGFFFEKGTVNSQYAIFIEGTQIKIRTSTAISGVADLQFTAASYIQANVWFLVTASYNNGLKRFYINGVLLGTQTVTGGFTINASGMSIGAYGGFSGAKAYYYSGDIANVKFYNIVLTDAEVSQNYEATRTRFGL